VFAVLARQTASAAADGAVARGAAGGPGAFTAKLAVTALVLAGQDAPVADLARRPTITLEGSVIEWYDGCAYATARYTTTSAGATAVGRPAWTAGECPGGLEVQQQAMAAIVTSMARWTASADGAVVITSAAGRIEAEEREWRPRAASLHGAWTLGSVEAGDPLVHVWLTDAVTVILDSSGLVSTPARSCLAAGGIVLGRYTAGEDGRWQFVRDAGYEGPCDPGEDPGPAESAGAALAALEKASTWDADADEPGFLTLVGPESSAVLARD
jgi:hypothetical protein